MVLMALQSQAQRSKPDRSKSDLIPRPCMVRIMAMVLVVSQKQWPGWHYVSQLSAEQRRSYGSKWVNRELIYKLIKQVLVFFNDIIRNIILSNDAEILMVYYGYREFIRKHTDIPLQHFTREYSKGYRIYLIPWKDLSRENLTNNLYVTCNNHSLSRG